MFQVKLDVTLTLEGPILTKSSVPGSYGADASMAKNDSNKYIIPGTLVKGRLRQAWEELKDIASYISDDEINKLLGNKSGNSDNSEPVDPSRAILRFSDFVSEKESVKTLHRIRIDEDKGTVAKGAILIMETPFAPKEEVCFHGQIEFIATDQNEITKNIDYIKKGLMWINSLGSERTVGFGKLVNVNISQRENQIQPLIETSAVSKNGKLCLIMMPKSPFCIAKRRIDENLFESEIFIPGNAIKGTIATMWRQLLGCNEDKEIDENFDSERNQLCKYFDKIRFRHAFPVESSETKRPVSPPLSLVKIKDDKSYYDVALCDTPVLINGNAPEFRVDWKDSSDVDKDFGWINPKKELRVRTAINREKRKSEENKLFAYEMIVPTGFRWISWIDMGLIPEDERTDVEKQLRGLLAIGLNGLGKTKASVSAELEDYSHVQPFYSSKLEPIDNQYIVTLQTPAILCDPKELNETSGKIELFNAYEKIWKQMSDDSLTLKRYFASQSLAGGYYLHRRFREGKQYRPYLLTDAGSVFVLRVVDEAKAKEKIEEWFNYGLPLPKWAKEEYKRNGREGDHWSNCPYIRENGYGEIAVNIDIHISKKPKEEQVCEIVEYGE